MVIAIDGPGGVGKSTVARAVAERLGAAYLDTGAYYRAVTVAVLRAGADPDDPEAVVQIARNADLGFDGTRMYLDGKDVSDAIRSVAVTGAVSAVSAIPELRLIVVARQRRWVEDHDCHAVVEGRDIGTVVFPEASVKVFLTADPSIRAMRRARDSEAAGQHLAEIEDALERRDTADSTRAASPLMPADDAVTIDTSWLDADGVAAIVLGLVAQAEPG
jgi:cytidylate kinase